MAPKKKFIPALTIENARIMFRNFSGAEKQYNAKGMRNFCLVLENDVAEQMEKDGWNVKYLPAREEGDTPTAFIKVNVRFKDDPNDSRNPKLVMISSRGQTRLSEEEASLFDFAHIQNVDVKVNPYVRDPEEGRVTAYLASIFITIVEDDLDRKYADIPEAGGAAAALTERENEPEYDGWNE